MSNYLTRGLLATSATLIVFAAAFGLARSAPADLYTVNSTLDLPDADLTDNVCATSPSATPVCTLRAAVMQANAHIGPDSIYVPSGTYALTCVGYDANAACGDLDVTDDLTIQSTGGPVIVDANGGATFDRAFEVINHSLTLQGLTVQNGNTPSYGGGIYAHGPGTLQLTNVIVQNNSAALQGGGIYAAGPNLQVSSSTFQGNISKQSGGGIHSEGSAAPYPQLSLSDTVFTNNQSQGGLGEGGGVETYNTYGSIQNATFQNNVAAYSGGGLEYTATASGLSLWVTNTLVLSNTATVQGGGLYLYGQTNLTGTQVLSNAAQSAGGILAYYGTHTLNDVQVSYNRATSDSCGGIQLSSGNLNMNRGWVQSNTAPTLGGGLCTSGAGTIRLAITDTNVLNNSSGNGGGVWVGNSFFAARSAIYDNGAAYGGGLYSEGLTTIENTTLSGNSAGRDGGGIYAAPSSTVRLNSTTIASNFARTSFPQSGVGGGVYISSTAVVSAANTLLGLNSNSTFIISPSDCFGALRSEAYDFVGSNSGCTITGDPTGNHIGGSYPNNIDPRIAPLSSLGGLTPGHLPLAGSPLINAGPPVGCQSANGLFLFVDQIGHFRSSQGRCDIGSLEYFDRWRLYLPVMTR